VAPISWKADLPRPLKQRYPLVKPKERPVTLAIGVSCYDGVVLGVDGQLSVDNAKLTTQKITWFFPFSDYQLVFAAQGHGDPSRLAIDLIRKTLSAQVHRHLTVSEITAYISSCLDFIYRNHIDAAPSADERSWLNFSLLIAIRQERSAQLFRTNRDMVVPINPRPHPWWCLGVGTEFANYALSLLLDPHCSAEVAAQVVAYIIGEANELVEGVGKGTDVHVLQNDGTHWSFSAPDIRQLENEFSEFFLSLRDIVSCVDTETVGDSTAKLRLAYLEQKIFSMRSSQRLRKEREARQQASVRARRPNHESPTGD
jgi:20S proteasome alpha/beta subunit